VLVFAALLFAHNLSLELEKRYDSPLCAQLTFRNPMQHLLRFNFLVARSTQLAFAPLSHLAEYVNTNQALIYGSKICFPVYSYTFGDQRRPSIAHDIIGDLKLCRVTELNTVPRTLDMIMELFEGEVAEALVRSGARTERDKENCKSAVRQKYREGLVFGPQLRLITWGSAPISSKTKNWVHDVWGGCDNVSLVEGYGSSEGGTITANEMVTDMVVCFVVDASEYGFSLENGQGQVVVHSNEVQTCMPALYMCVNRASCLFISQTAMCRCRF
jgi:long-subunit acyl-CoA synthetase (AMP-forming)